MTNVPLPSYPFISKHDEEHKAACEERSRGLEIRLESKLQEMRAAEVTQRAHERSTEMLDRAARAKNAASKVEWLMKAIDIAVAPSKGLTACSKGCSHCCHISLDISEAEARVIHKATGRRLDAKAGIAGEEAERGISERQKRATGVACPFLSRVGTCTIYDVRPFNCRSHVNVDQDDLLCRLTTAEEDEKVARVPYLEMRHYKASYRSILGSEQRFADIRGWFPR
ncbi:MULTISPECIES: YkgJ family cysteine cluster protein [unclassified Variovorax]|uniref:YkgJ family cysteine cluster protein n=1 Tax=unclassified Variovorax TaxID=663243 RepID=UPI0008391DE6|nr:MULTISPECIES: YkgJ family cysteine cluster protein [unclassified Variovorax]PNG48787.1 hypothetical protein CHC06_06528 [Variovorax sp. B2]PNG49294.1 hypothetical protein CHC07_06176 [Variovorax sp. B4]VTV18432.1 hypothetical protein WDL1P2_00148 [Variovorax sp. WDL1]